MDTTGSNSSSPSPSSSTAANTSDFSLSVSTSSSSTTTATITTRSKRQELSFAERIQVILARKGGKSMRQLALQFGCGKTQILNILGQRESYLREWEEKEGPSNPHIGARKRRSRRTGNEETNRLVWDWYQQQKNSGLRVTGPMLQREARSIARSLGIANFAASNGWLDSFRRLHNIGPQSKAQEQRTPSTVDGGESAATNSMAAASDPLVVDIHPAAESLPTPSSSVAYESEFIPIPAPQHYAPAASSQSCGSLYEPLAGFSLPTAYDQLVDSYDPHNPYSSLGTTRDSNEFDPLVDVVGSVTSTSSTDRSGSANQHTIHSQEQQEQQQESPSEYKHFANMAAVFHDPPEFDASLMHQHASLIYPTAISATSYGDDGSAASFASGGLQSHSAVGPSSASFLGSLEDVFQLPTYSAVAGRSQLSDESASAAHCPLALAPVEDDSAVIQTTKVTPSPFKSVIQSHPGLDPLLPLDLGDLQQHQEHTQQPYPASAVRRSVLVSTRSAAASSNSTEEKRRRLISSTEDQTSVASANAFYPAESRSWTSAPSDRNVDDQAARLPHIEESALPSYAGLLSMARSRSLQSSTFGDGEGNQWLEIRSVTAAYRVPLHSYRTHLVRLIIDQKLNYWIEVVGRCIRSGSFRPPNSPSNQVTADPALAAPVLDALAGGFSVCQGRGSVLKRVGQFHPRLVVQHAAAERMSFTLPDYRYRSFDCSYWIDSRTGPRCAACRASYRRPTGVTNHPLLAVAATSSDSASASPRSSPGEPLNLSLHTPQDMEEMPGLQPITVLHVAGQNLLQESEDTSCSSYLTIDHDHRLAQETARCMTLHGHSMMEDQPSESRSFHEGDSHDAERDVLEAEFEAIAVKQEPMDSPSESSSSSRDSQRLQ